MKEIGCTYITYLAMMAKVASNIYVLYFTCTVHEDHVLQFCFQRQQVGRKFDHNRYHGTEFSYVLPAAKRHGQLAGENQLS